MVESRLELLVTIQRHFMGDITVSIASKDSPDTGWRFEGTSKSIGEAFTNAYVQIATQLSFDGMAQCRICVVNKATHICRFDGGKNSQIRCEGCAKLSVGYPKGWEELPK